MDMYITALEPAPATLGPQAEGCLSPEPEAGGTANNIAPISRQIWDAKYRLKTYDGTPIDVTIEDSWRRVARALAAAENDPEQSFAIKQNGKVNFFLFDKEEQQHAEPTRRTNPEYPIRFGRRQLSCRTGMPRL
jgi:hypothetical protein